MLEELTARIVCLSKRDDILTLLLPDAVSWKVEYKFVAVDMRPFVQDAFNRVKEVAQAEALVTTDQEVMGGAPVFAGTRVPLDIVLSSLSRGIAEDRLKASYPFLTEAHIQAARVYEEVHPRRGRPRRLSEANPDLPRRITRFSKRTTSA